jgi:ankyrin repeat protein
VSPTKQAAEDVLEKATIGVDSMDRQDAIKDVAGRQSPFPASVPEDAVDVKGRETNASIGIKSSPPVMNRPETKHIDTNPLNGSKEPVDAGNKSDSEAETIVLPGKDGHSPSKIRKSIKHEDKSDDEDAKSARGINISHGTVAHEAQPRLQSQAGGMNTAATSTSSLGKRKRQKVSNVKDDPAHIGNSSGLSSVPTSPVATTRSSLSKPAASDSDVSRSPSPRARSTTQITTKSADRVVELRDSPSQSGDEDENERARFVRQQSVGTETKHARENRSSSKFQPDSHSRKRSRSISPPARVHKRSTSTQVVMKSSHGMGHKKKRVPAPLQSTEFHSDDSSESDRSHPRSSRLRSLAAPNTGGSTMSPVKIAPHKKHVNSSGQTFLARACLSGKLEVVKQRYDERPEDLNEPDHALNTPLHVASISGHEDVVKFLLDKNCTVDVINDQKDTPLHDAIENGHVEVVKLLFEAGADPNKPNRHGDEPLDLVNEKEESGTYKEDSDASKIRAAILEAKLNNRDVRRVSEDEMSNHRDGARQSPSVPTYDSHTLHATARRVGTARSQKTSDHLLYQPLTATELQKAAKEGDASAAARVLEVHTNLNDPKSLTLAAKGGHLDVLNILFAMGGFDPDPPLASGVSLEQATPILAAIGRDAHLKVIELILGQDNFNPTRRIKGQTYIEIVKERAGPKWQEEEKLFKDAIERYEKTHKSSPRKPRSPGMRRDARDANRDARKGHKADEELTARSHKRSISSPKTKEHDPKSSRSNGISKQIKDGQVRRGPGRPRKEESSGPAVTSDPESTPLGPPKPKSQVKRSESEVGVTSENETAAKPRRKLVSGKELRGERELEQQRRTSIASNASNVSTKDKRVLNDGIGEKNDERLSPRVARLGKKVASAPNEHETPEKLSSDKDRARSIMRDESKDRITAIRGESPVKRHRKSETPPRSGMQEIAGYSAGGGPLKRRKLEGEGAIDSISDSTPTSSPDVRTSAVRSPLPSHDDIERRHLHTKSKPPQPFKTHNQTSEGAARVPKNESPPVNRATQSSDHRPAGSQELEPKKPKPATEDHPTRPDQDVEREREREKVKAAKRKEEEQAREADAQRAAEVAREKEAEAAREKERETARQKKLEEEEEVKRVEQANIARLAREEAAREEENKRQAEEAERREAQRIQDAEAATREMERQRVLYLEQQKAKHDEQERRRALQAEQQRAERARIAEEERLERLSKLPLLLRWLDQSENPKNRDVASHFQQFEGYRFDTIRPEATTDLGIGREQWMLNTNVAILLGEKDLQLSRCKSQHLCLLCMCTNNI